jgi:PAS domain S-box-containing protein
MPEAAAPSRISEAETLASMLARSRTVLCRLVLDDALTVIEAAGDFTGVLGPQGPEALAEGLYEIVAPAERSGLLRQVGQLRDGELSELRATLRLRGRIEEANWLEIHARWCEDPRDPPCLDAVLTNVTERMRREHLLRLRRFSTDRVRDCIFWLDPSGRCVEVNHAACKRLGYDREELIRLSLQDFDPVFLPEKWQRQWEMLKGCGSTRLESMHRTSSGEVFPVEIDASYVYHEGNEYICAIARDISESQRIKNDLQERVKELGAMLALARLIRHQDPEEIEVFLNKAILLLPPGFHDPEHTRAEIHYDGNCFACGPYLGENVTFLDHDILVDGEVRGALRVQTSGMRDAEEAFLPEERSLLKAFANSLGRAIEHNQSLRALRRSEQENRVILDNVRLGIVLLDPDMRVLRCNRQMNRWFPDGAFDSRPICHKVLHDPPRENVCRQCPTVKALADGQVHEARIQSARDGQIRQYRVVASPVFDDEGEIIGSIEIIEDITETLKFEQDLQRIHAAVDNATDAIAILDLSGKVTYANMSLGEILRNTRDGLEGFTLQRYFPEAEDYDQLMHGASEPWGFQGEVNVRDSEGRTFPALVRSSSIVQDGLYNIGALIVINDISEAKRVESETRHAMKLQSIGQLAAGIAHEINTPAQYVGDNMGFLGESYQSLREILEGYGRLLEADSADDRAGPLVEEISRRIEEEDLEFLLEEIPRALDQSREGIERIRTIVASMKEFSHPAQGGRVTFDINRCVRSTVTVARNEWKYVSEMHLELAEDLPPVECVPDEINQVLLNLLVNSAQALQEQSDSGEEMGEIRIRTSASKGGVELTLSDTGPGIAPKDQPRVFDPFFTTKDVGQGTGQGLAIAHGIIVDRHGGTIRLESVPGEGTTFRIWLPGAEDGIAETAGETAEDDPAQPPRELPS